MAIATVQAGVTLINDGDLDLHVTFGADKGGTLGMKSDEQLLNLGGDQFLEVADVEGITDTFGRGRSVAWGDFNNDGYADLLLGNLKTDLVLYQNNGDQTFTDVTAAAGLGGLQFNECDFADYNNDGLADVFCTDVEAFGQRTERLYKNNGDGTFTDVTAEAGIAPLSQGRSVTWADYDNDGNLDLFITRGTDVAMEADSLS